MRSRIVCAGVALLVLVIALAACQSVPAPAPTVVPPTAEPAVAPTTAPPTAVPPTAAPTAALRTARYDEATAKKLWEAGPHNNEYDLYRGPNTYCARCHSPRNWDPKATVGKAPNCFSCKFPTDKEVRISPQAPLIPEDNWAKVGCDTCHPDGKGPRLAIWNNGTGQFDPVLTSTQLCEKCHTDSLGGTRHKIRLGGGAHSNQIGTTEHRPELCIDCHDPHSGEASCSNATCHTDVLKPEKKIEGHDAAHAKVTCVACHDASGMAVGLDEASKMWTTGTNAVSRGTTTFTPAFSHDFKKGVECNRCHFEKNPWKLWVPTPTPAPARPTATPAR